MFDYVFQALKEHALPCCPFCQSKYEGEEQSLNGPVLKWECGTVATHKENKWYRSTDCRDQQVRLLVNDNNALRAEVEAQVQVLLRVRRSLWEDLPDEALHTLRDHLTPRGLWEAKEDAHN